MTGPEAVGIGLGFLAIVAPDFWPKMPRALSYTLAAVGLSWLTYSGILAIQEATHMKMQHGPLAAVILGAVFIAGGIGWHISRIPAEGTHREQSGDAPLLPAGKGGRGGSGAVEGDNAVIIGGRGGRGGVPGGGSGGDGGSGFAKGDNALVIGGDGGEAGQAGRSARGGRSPLERLEELGLGSDSTRFMLLYGRLRQEYILSHDGLSPELMSGSESLPEEWVNKRLSELGHAWRVKNTPTGFTIEEMR